MKFIFKTLLYGLTLLNPFTNSIVSSASEITSPQQNDVWLAGNTYPIEWQDLDSNSIQIKLGVQKNLSANEWTFEDESGHDYLSVLYDSSLNSYDWSIPLTMINLWEYPLRIFIKEIDTNNLINSQNFNIAGMSVISPNNNESFNEYDMLPITWKFNSLFNEFNISLCESSADIYNINISECSYSIIKNLNPNSIELSNLEMTYNWEIPELLDITQTFKILISSMQNNIMMLSKSFLIDNTPSTTPTTTVTSTATTTVTTTPTTTITSTPSTTITSTPSTTVTSTATTTIGTTTFPKDNVSDNFPIYIPILLILAAVLLILILYCFVKNCMVMKVSPNKVKPVGREFYNHQYDTTGINNNQNIEYIEYESDTNRGFTDNSLYQEAPNHNNSRNLNNNIYNSTSFGGYGVYYDNLTPNGSKLPNTLQNDYNRLNRNNECYCHLNNNKISPKLQDKLKKTVRKDEPNMNLIRKINQEIHQNMDLDNRNLQNPTYI
jgi:hypothetical protein